MRSGRSDNDSVAHSQREKFLQASNVEIARCGAEAVTRKPHVAVARLDFPYLRQLAGRPVARARRGIIASLRNSGWCDSRDDRGLALDRFRLLALHREQVTLAQVGQRHLASRAVGLALLIAK